MKGRLMTMRRIVLKSRASAEADCILFRYQQEWGWIDTWPMHILDRCDREIREAVE